MINSSSNNRQGAFKKRINSFGYAFKGIAHVFVSQINFRIHVLAAIFALFLGFYLDINYTEWALLTITISLVFAAELINSSIEYLTDLVSPEWNEKAGKIKDMAAAAVLILAISSVVIAFLLFGPKIIEKL